MNEQLRRPNLTMTTQAAEGLPRRRWTVAEIEAMVAGGILLEDERFELIGGEVVPMSPKGNQHELVKKALQRFWFPRLPAEIELITETTLRIDADHFLEPDFLFWPRSIPLKDVSAGNALLIVEVSDSSLGYDLGRKADLYASLGLAELWVIDAVRRVTHVHTGPASAGYAQKREVAPDIPLDPGFAPRLAVRLADLDLT